MKELTLVDREKYERIDDDLFGIARRIKRIDDGYFLRAVSAQSDVFRKTLKRGDARSVLKTTAAFTGLIEKAEATYRALGGKDEPNEETLKLALKYSGDVFGETLAPAYLRESGYTELISV